MLHEPAADSRHQLLQSGYHAGNQPYTIIQQARISRIVNIRFHYRGINAQFLAPDYLALFQLQYQRFIQGFNRIFTIFVGELNQGGTFWYAILQGKMAETSPCKAVLDLFHQYLITQLITILQVHHTEVGSHGCSRPAHTGTKLLLKRSQEALITEQFVYLRQLFIHLKKLRW